jgi:glycine betaine/choline ABC-type transport system substrate-binding protein
MNLIREAGKQERFESGNHESRKSKQFQRFLLSWLPDFFLIFSCVPVFLIHSSSAAEVVIGSKRFTESYVLGEIAKRTLTDAGIPAEHRQGMGGTIILWEALRGGQINARKIWYRND